jgi:uncharacterized protein
MHRQPEAGMTADNDWNPQGEIKIVFAGPMGAGKTTAIRAISSIEPVQTEVDNNDRAAFDKDSTTVALDFGQLELDDGTVVRLYGTPGQSRFDFMWTIIGRGALGVVLLLDATQADALNQMDAYLGAFDSALRSGAMVIGLGRSEQAGALSIEPFQQRLGTDGPPIPLFCVDVRRRADVLMLISALMCQLEIHHPGATQA